MTTSRSMVTWKAVSVLRTRAAGVHGGHAVRAGDAPVVAAGGDDVGRVAVAGPHVERASLVTSVAGVGADARSRVQRAQAGAVAQHVVHDLPRPARPGPGGTGAGGAAPAGSVRLVVGWLWWAPRGAAGATACACATVDAVGAGEGGRPQVGEVGAADGEADAVAGLEAPGGAVQLDRAARRSAPGSIGSGSRQRVAPRAVEDAAADQGAGAVRGHVAEAGDEGHHRRRRADVQHGLGPADDLQRLLSGAVV